MQVIYIDMLFLLNFVMDTIIFWMSIRILGHRVRFKKLLVASLVAASIYCLVIIVPLFNRWPTFILQLLVPIVSILYLFRADGLKSFVKSYVVCTLTAWAIGGVSFNFYYVLGKQQEMTPLLPIGAGLLLCIILFLGFGWIRKRCIAPYFEYEVIIDCEGSHVVLDGYLDTGNRLYTVGNQKPVMIGTYEALIQILSESQKKFLKRCHQEGIEKSLNSAEALNSEKYYLIPFNSIGCKEGILVGVSLGKIQLKRGQWHHELADAIVAVHFEKLFNGDEYDILIHPDYMKFE